MSIQDLKSFKSAITPQKISDFRDKFKNYLDIFRLVIKDIIISFKYKLLLVVLSSLLGLFLQVGAIGIAIGYARALEKGMFGEVLGFAVHARSTSALFLCVVTVTIAILCAAALLQYSRVKTIIFACDYEKICSKKVFEIVFRCSGLCSSAIIGFYDKKHILRLATTDARFCGKVSRMLLGMHYPVFAFIVSFIALLYINIWLTMIVLFGISLSLFFHYPNNRMGVKSSLDMEKTTPLARSEKNKILDGLLGTLLIKEDFNCLIQRFFDTGNIKKNMDAYNIRFQVIQNAYYINTFLTAFLFCLIFFVIGGQAIRAGAGWEKLAIYFLAMHYSIKQLQIILGKITSINRFYPYFSRYQRFMSEASLFLKGENCHVSDTEYSLKSLEPSALPGSKNRISLTNGCIYGVIIPGPFDLKFFKFYVLAMFERNSKLVKEIMIDSLFVRSNFVSGVSQYSLLYDFLNEPDFELNIFINAMVQIGIDMREFEPTLEKLRHPFAQESMQNISSEIFSMLALFICSRHKSRFVFINSCLLDKLSSINKRKIIDFLRDENKIVFIMYYGNLANIGSNGEDLVAILSDKYIVGMGGVDWYHNHESVIQDIYKKSVELFSKITSSSRYNDEDEDDYDDE